MKKIIVLLLLTVMLAAMISGCSSASEKSVNVEAISLEPVLKESSKLKKEPLRIGLVLPGSINDMGWNASAFLGLMQIEDEFGAEVLYVENVEWSEMEETFRNFAMQGFDIVFGHGYQFGEAAAIVAEQYPGTKFIITSSTVSNNLNLASVDANGTDQGFLAGALAALISESGQVGAIGGMDIPPIRNSLVGYVAGAKYVNPDIVVNTVMLGSFDDISEVKETAVAMIDRGVDVILTNSNEGGLASIEACEEHGIMAIGLNQDQYFVAPGAVIASVIKSTPRLFTYIVTEVEEERFIPQFYELDMIDGVLGFADWHGYDDIYPEAFVAVNEIMAGIVDGSVIYDVSQYDI